MTQQFLDNTQVRPTFEQVCGVGVAKRVGVDMASFHAIIKDSTNVAGAQSTTPTIKEECFIGRVGPLHFLAAFFDPQPKGRESALVQWDNALFLTLSEHA